MSFLSKKGCKLFMRGRDANHGWGMVGWGRWSFGGQWTPVWSTWAAASYHTTTSLRGQTILLEAGRPQGRYYRPLVDNRPFCPNGRYSWICGRYCIKMVNISSKSHRMLIVFPYYSKHDKSQDLKLYYSAIKWSNMKITTSTLFYMYLLESRI